MSPLKGLPRSWIFEDVSALGEATTTSTSSTTSTTTELPYGAELHTNANAASITNEADATTGWGEAGLNGTGANVFESQAAIKSDGSWALHTDSNDTPTSGARIYLSLSGAPFSLSAGDECKVEIDARHIGSGANWGIWVAATNGGTNYLIVNLTSADTTFQTYTYEWTFATDSDWLVIKENGPNSGGVYIDKVSIKKRG